MKKKGFSISKNVYGFAWPLWHPRVEVSTVQIFQKIHFLNQGKALRKMSYSSAFWSNFENYWFLTLSWWPRGHRVKIGNFQSLTRKPSYSSFFSVLCPDLKNVFFGKIHWAPSEILEVAEAIFEVAEAKIWISSIFDEFSFRIFTVLSFEVVWPQRPRRPQKGPSEFFQKLHFWNQCVQTKKMRYVTTLSSTFSLNLPTEEVWCIGSCLWIEESVNSSNSHGVYKHLYENCISYPLIYWIVQPLLKLMAIFWSLLACTV